MRPEPRYPYCDNQNVFSSALAPAIEKRLPQRGSLAARVLDHTTGIRPFIDQVSSDLCDSSRMSTEGRHGALGFIARSATSAAIIGGSATLAALGLVVGSPVIAIGAGVAGLAILPPLAERAVLGVASFAEDLLAGIRGLRE